MTGRRTRVYHKRAIFMARLLLLSARRDRFRVKGTAAQSLEIVLLKLFIDPFWNQNGVIHNNGRSL